MKNGTKLTLGIGLIYAILLAIINVLVFTVFKPLDITNEIAAQGFWWSYAFLTLAFVLSFASVFLFDRKKGIDAVFMGLPVYVISIAYFVCEAVLAVIFMILAAFNVETPLSLVIVSQLVLLAIFLVIAIMAFLAKNIIAGMDEKIKTNVRNIRNLVSDVELIAMVATDPTIKKQLNEFLEAIKYSDPMSTELTFEIDERLKQIINSLRDAVNSGNNAVVENYVKQGILTVKQRNSIIVNNKR